MPEQNGAQEGAQTPQEGAEATATAQEAQQRPEGVSEAEWSALGDPGKAALVRERQRVAELEQQVTAANAKVGEFERSKLSDIERAQAEAQEAKEAAAKAATEALRWRTAAKFGISDEDAETFLTGADEATITRQAERLAAFKQSAPAGPRPDLSQGGKGAPALNSDALEDGLRAALGI